MPTRRRRADLASASSAAEVLIAGRLAVSTVKRYAASMKVLQQFWSEHYPRSQLAPPLEMESIVNFFGWLIDTKYKENPPAFSTIRGYKSAVVYLYKEQGMTLQPDIDLQLESLLDGYKRRVADLKLSGRMPIFEGKLHLTFEGYRSLARALMKSTSAQMLFAWPYLLLQWNLIARAKSVAMLMMEHISWESDALLVTIPKHKGDQEGSNVFPRHLYANPSDPFICPVLSLAVLVFVRVLRFDPVGSSSSSQAALPNYRLFDGDNSETRFSDIFKKVITALPAAEAQHLGGSKKELGTHSVRKGAATYCTGMVNGPSPIAVFLRAGWGLGGVKDRYLFGGTGGDQLTGRVLSGLPYNDVSFASLPPHFDSVGGTDVRWSAVFPLYTTLPDTIKRALPFLLASICHHETWLRSTLPADHQLFVSPLFTSGALESLRVHVLSGCYRSLSTGLTATGIPPHLAMSNELTAVVKQTEEMKVQLLSQYSSLPSKVADCILSQCSVNGAVPVTPDVLRSMLAQAVSQMSTHMREVLPEAVRAAAPAAAADPNGNDGRFRLWTWGGQLHPVPEGWRLSSTDVMSTWRLWHFGNPAERIRPLRHLEKADLADQAQVTQWSKTRGVMTAISERMISIGSVTCVEEIGRLTEEVATPAFTRAITQLMEELKPDSTRKRSRWTEMRMPTLYTHVMRLKNERKRRREQEIEVVDPQPEPVEDEESEGSERPAQRVRVGQL
jgi:hypothetical protein